MPDWSSLLTLDPIALLCAFECWIVLQLRVPPWSQYHESIFDLSSISYLDSLERDEGFGVCK